MMIQLVAFNVYFSEYVIIEIIDKYYYLNIGLNLFSRFSPDFI